MATIKSYTDLEQSKKLAEILPLESADMYYSYYLNPISGASYYEDCPIFHIPINKNKSLPCWSLAALLGVLPEGIIENYYAPNLQKENGKYSIAYGNDELLCTASNPVDACVDLIEKLYKLNLFQL